MIPELCAGDDEGLTIVLPPAVNTDKKSDGNPPQWVCYDGKHLNTLKDRSCHGRIIAKCCHECNKKYGEPCRNENSDCPYTLFPVLFDMVDDFQDASLLIEFCSSYVFFYMPASRLPGLPVFLEFLSIGFYQDPPLVSTLLKYRYTL